MTVEIDIEHIGGINAASARIEDGLNVIRGTNWQGKSSFVESIETGLGIPGTVTEGSEAGRVVLEGPDRDAEVTLSRSNGKTVLDGQPWLADRYDQIRAELYACLGERNPVRQAVRNGKNLEEVLSRPLDFENIDERIAELTRERDEIDAEREKARDAKDKIPKLEDRIQTIESQIQEHRERLEELDGAGETTDSEEREALSQARAERDQLDSRIERLDRSIERYVDQIEEKRGELEALPEGTAEVDPDRLAELRESQERLRSEIKVLESLHSSNRLVLEENRLDLVSDVQRGLAGDQITCWVCGSETSRETVQEYLDELESQIRERRGALEDRRDEIEELEAVHEERQQAERRRRTLKEDIRDLEDRVADRRESKAELETAIQEIEERIEELRESVDQSVEAVTDLESEIKYRQAELEEAEDELDQLQTRASRLDHLNDQRGEIAEELARLRDRKTDIKRRTREAFHDNMQGLLERFDTGFETARLTDTFEIVVARDGHEAQLDALSEGELELLGFVAALAGYEAFDVGETVPFLLIDGVESLDDENLHRLVEYFGDRSTYLVITAHPEHTGFDGNEIDPGEWDVVSDRQVLESEP